MYILTKIVRLFQVLAERVDNMTRQIRDLEDKAQSLQLTIDRLSAALNKRDEEESIQKDTVRIFSVLSYCFWMKYWIWKLLQTNLSR